MPHLPLRHPRLLLSTLDQAEGTSKKMWPSRMAVVLRANGVDTEPSKPELMFVQ